jgi:hypothetical protein
VGLQTEFAFTLPKGYVGHDGSLHRRGVMRLSTARDEIEPLRDSRLSGPDDPYLTILVIARVVKELGSLDEVTEREVEGMFAADLAFLQDLYGIINFGDPADADALQRAVLPTDDTSPDVVDNPVVTDSPVAVVAVDDDEPAPTKPRSAKAEKAEPNSPRRRGRIEEITHSAGS